MLSRVLLAAALVIGLSAALQAQTRRSQQGRQPMVPQASTDIQGTIQRAMPGGVMLTETSTNQPWQVAIPATAKIQVTGGATADYLQRGMVVEFKAEIDDKHSIKDKVEELKVITLSPGTKPGLFPPDTKLGDNQGGFGAVGTDIAGTGGKPAKRTAATAGKGAAKAGGIAVGTYRIVGRLIVRPDGKFSVVTPRGKLAFELSEKPAIGVDMADYTMAGQGDKVSVKGDKVPNRQGLMQMQALEVKIELAEPLVGGKKKGAAAKSETKHPAKHVKKDEGLPEPAADK